MFERIKRFHSRGLWNDAQVWDAVYFKEITPEQFNIITKLNYDADKRPEESK